MDVALTTGMTTQMYPNFPNTRPQAQQVVDLKLARDLKAYAQSWLQVMNPPR